MNRRIKKKLDKRLNCFRYNDYFEKRQIDYYLKKYKELYGEIRERDIIHIVWNNLHSKRRKILKFQVLKDCKIKGCNATEPPNEVEINFSCNLYRSPEVDKVTSQLRFVEKIIGPSVYDNWIKGIS